MIMPPKFLFQITKIKNELSVLSRIAVEEAEAAEYAQQELKKQLDQAEEKVRILLIAREALHSENQKLHDQLNTSKNNQSASHSANVIPTELQDMFMKVSRYPAPPAPPAPSESAAIHTVLQQIKKNGFTEPTLKLIADMYYAKEATLDE
jgi:hypothetical protein